MGWGGYNFPNEWFKNSPDIAKGGGINLVDPSRSRGMWGVCPPAWKELFFPISLAGRLFGDASRPYGGYNAEGGVWNIIGKMEFWIIISVLILIVYLVMLGKLKI